MRGGINHFCPPLRNEAADTDFHSVFVECVCVRRSTHYIVGESKVYVLMYRPAESNFAPGEVSVQRFNLLFTP